jgi:hypothetical protein
MIQSQAFSLKTENGLRSQEQTFQIEVGRLSSKGRELWGRK